jgi:hypothetical protein
MTKMLVITLVLVAAVACGGKKPQAAANRRSVATAPTSHKPTRSSKAGSAPKTSRRTSAKPDTANRNPLTNH